MDRVLGDRLFGDQQHGGAQGTAQQPAGAAQDHHDHQQPRLGPMQQVGPDQPVEAG